MRHLLKASTAFLALAALAISACPAYGQTIVASEDFDGGDTNLITGFDVANNLDGGGGDFYGVGSIDAWPQLDEDGNPLGVPFGIMDESATLFPPDVEGILSDVVSDRTNNFFAISDTREWTDDLNGDPTFPLVTSWTFDISGSSNPLQLNIDMGQMSDGEFGFNEGYVLFEYSIDGGPFQQAFTCDPFDSAGSGFEYRLLDSGTVPVTGLVCQATSTGNVVKMSAGDGTVSDNTILDKCPPVGEAGEGTLDTFVADLVGNGSVLEIRMSTIVSFEAVILDNIVITEVGGGDGTVNPDTFNVVTGTYASGDVVDLEESDNVDLSVRRNPASFSPVISVEFKGVSPVAEPSSFEFKYEGAVFARSAIAQTISLFNYSTGEFDVIDTRNASRFNDRVDVVSPSGDFRDYVDPGTNCVEARIRLVGSNPRQTFSVNMDQIEWTIE